MRSYVPLDARWGMEDEYLTVEVREAVAFSCAHFTPEETAALLEKSVLFHPYLPPTQNQCTRPPYPAFCVAVNAPRVRTLGCTLGHNAVMT